MNPFRRIRRLRLVYSRITSILLGRGALRAVPVAGTALMLTAGSAHANWLHDAVQTVAQSKTEMVIMIAGKPAQVIYAGKFNGCDQVAVQRQRSSQQNFEICHGEVRDKHSVAPSWPVDGSVRQMLAMVVDNALREGHSAARDGNGYLIDARRQHDVGACSSVLIRVTYNGDLVDRATQQVCTQG